MRHAAAYAAATCCHARPCCRTRVIKAARYYLLCHDIVALIAFAAVGASATAPLSAAVYARALPADVAALRRYAP